MRSRLARITAIVSPKRRYAQFSLGTMLAVVTVLSVLLAWQVKRANQQRDVVAAIRSWEGLVNYDFESPVFSEATWRERMRTWLGDDFAAEVVSVMLPASRTVLVRKYKTSDRLPAPDAAVIDDAALRQIGSLRRLERLGLDGTSVTDAGLAEVGGFTRLKYLCLDRTDVTDSGVACLAGLARLEHLGLNDTEITGEALRSLAALESLQSLTLSRSRITDEDLKKLQRITKLRWLNLSNTSISDHGIAHLVKLRALRSLEIRETSVSPVGLSKLRKSLPRCNISW